MKNEKDCRECEIQHKVDSWGLSFICGIISGLIGCALGLLIHFNVL